MFSYKIFVNTNKNNILTLRITNITFLGLCFMTK